MLNQLVLGIGFIVALVSAIFIFYACTQKKKAILSFPFLLFLIALVGFSGAAYLKIGRFSDWQTAQVDVDQDPRLAAKITEARQLLQESPNDMVERRKLISLYMEAGQFGEAIKNINSLMEIRKQDPSLYALKAKALYYRDGKKLTPEVEEEVQSALRLNPREPSVKMFLAEDAFRNKDYEKAIGYWRSVLEAGNAPMQEKLIRTAIANAEQRLKAQQVQSTSTRKGE